MEPWDSVSHLLDPCGLGIRRDGKTSYHWSLGLDVGWDMNGLMKFGRHLNVQPLGALGWSCAMSYPWYFPSTITPKPLEELDASLKVCCHYHWCIFFSTKDVRANSLSLASSLLRNYGFIQIVFRLRARLYAIGTHCFVIMFWSRFAMSTSELPLVVEGQSKGHFDFYIVISSTSRA